MYVYDVETLSVNSCLAIKRVILICVAVNALSIWPRVDSRREVGVQCGPPAQRIGLRRLAVHQHHAAADTQAITPRRFRLIVNASCCLTNSAKLFDNALKCAIDLRFITAGFAGNVCHSVVCRAADLCLRANLPPGRHH